MRLAASTMMRSASSPIGSQASEAANRTTDVSPQTAPTKRSTKVPTRIKPEGRNTSRPSLTLMPSITSWADSLKGVGLMDGSLLDIADLLREQNIGRLPWWLLRLRQGGQVLAPGPATRPLQLIDPRDLAQLWMLSCAEKRIGGVFNSSTPAHTIGEVLDIAPPLPSTPGCDVVRSEKRSKTRGSGSSLKGHRSSETTAPFTASIPSVSVSVSVT